MIFQIFFRNVFFSRSMSPYKSLFVSISDEFLCTHRSGYKFSGKIEVFKNIFLIGDIFKFHSRLRSVQSLVAQPCAHHLEYFCDREWEWEETSGLVRLCATRLCTFRRREWNLKISKRMRNLFADNDLWRSIDPCTFYHMEMRFLIKYFDEFAILHTRRNIL